MDTNTMAILFIGYPMVLIVFLGSYRWTGFGFGINSFFVLSLGVGSYFIWDGHLLQISLYGLLPLQVINTLFYMMQTFGQELSTTVKKYHVRLSTRGRALPMRNIRRGVSIIGSAGSGKTESVVYPLLKHFYKNRFCGVIYDYKHFEITEMAYPLFEKGEVSFHIISFDDIYAKVNPIAPRYMEDEESVNEVSRVLLENLLEQRESIAMGSSKFFNDAVEGLLGGMIWKLKTDHSELCTLPHLIAIYQYLGTKNLIAWLSSNLTAKAMADAFISGKDSERQTAGVMGTLANAFKKISTRRIFMVLSADEILLDINNPNHPSVVSVVNNPKYETAYSPVIATILHTITKQMSVRNRKSSFVLMEEAPTIRLLNMHRIPATLRSYDIATVYVLQDKIQNDMTYGDKASRAILSNLSYQFFGKANDPDTAKYYERFFEIIKKPTISISKSSNWNFDSRITKGEREVSKIRSDVFFRLKQGEFVAFADGRERKVRFPIPHIKRALPEPKYTYNDAEIQANFERIHLEARQLFRSKS
ncbi:type IV secretory system conjugative DNA transfer family protein [Maribacter polysaccharolyticus]|uniref:type IV secretory system conjugative DNA transfer family protein n=1 Tax=Maribacter polysaccharolyticus TaxID=3020831 RepID=UPI00237FCBAC|nr:type IV secretion system DNA-binding domain-containing protein [Maribacter polysaccharolyticus]MDE3742103.1 type IV secretion system DNA-binding domain-containing protein [Maribacter polysaccharolyticus]